MPPVPSLLWTAWTFAIIHFGIVLVLVGVFGEIAMEWNHTKGSLARLKKVFWVLLVLGLALEFGEAARSDNEVIALNKKIEQNAPLNQPVESIRADVSFTILRRDLNEVYQLKPDQLGDDLKNLASLFLIRDGVRDPKANPLVELKCTDVQVGHVGSDDGASIHFAFSFSWPGANIMDAIRAEHPADVGLLIDEEKVTVAQFDKDNLALEVLLPVFKNNAEILSSSCKLTINNERRFASLLKFPDGEVVFSSPLKPDKQ